MALDILVGMEKAINELASQAEASDASLHPLGGLCLMENFENKQSM
jgi:hypothetical protein